MNIENINPSIISGEERSFLLVHHKSKKVTDSGKPIIIKKVAKKTTYFTEEQVLYV